MKKLAVASGDDGSPSTVRDLFVALNDADTVKIVFLAAMIAAVSIGARRTAVLPRWFATYGFVTAPLLAISGFAVVPDPSRRGA